MSAHHWIKELPIWSGRQWLLGTFFLASGFLAWWQLRPGLEETLPELQRPRLPEYVVSRLTALETDEMGRPARRLVADELRQFVDEDVSELDQPRLTIYADTGEPWRARANSGLLPPGGEEIQLRGAVELRRAASSTQPATDLETEQINIWHKRDFADTDLPVRIRSGPDWLTATGMRLWYGEPMRAQLDGRVHALVIPTEADKP